MWKPRLPSKLPLPAIAVVVTAALALAACTPTGERTQLSVGYYSIIGTDFDELDRQIELHGPQVSGAGKAIAATNIRMTPDFRFERTGSGCVVKSARVTVNAHVTLPRLGSQERLKRGLSSAWASLEEYTRLHEAVHVEIADAHAVKAELAVRSLPPAADCTVLKIQIEETFNRIMAEHEAEQAGFDRDERSRIMALVRKARESSLN